jgi:hypothetical protein
LNGRTNTVAALPSCHNLPGGKPQHTLIWKAILNQKGCVG